MATKVADPGNVGIVTLAERMRKVVDDGHMPSIRVWGERAGLSHETLNKFLRAVDAGKPATMRLSSLVKLCSVAPMVDPGWLMSGAGTPYGSNELAEIKARLTVVEAQVVAPPATLMLPERTVDTVEDAEFSYADRVRRIGKTDGAPPSAIDEVIAQAAKGGVSKRTDRQIQSALHKIARRDADKAEHARDSRSIAERAAEIDDLEAGLRRKK